MTWKFTHIEHPARIAMGVTVLEYCVLDILYQSQTHPSFTKNGWANVGCHKIADFLDLSPSTVLEMLDRLLFFGFIEFHEETKSLKRTTPKWYNVAYIKEEEKLKTLDVRKPNRKLYVRKPNSKRSETELDGVRKPNSKRSETEPIYKVSNLVTNSNKGGDTNKSLFEVEIKEPENKWFPKKDIKLLDSYIKVFEEFKVITNRSRVQKETESNINAVLAWLRKKFTAADIISVIKDRATKVDPKYHELPTLLRKEFFENTLNRIKEQEEKRESQMTVATSWRNSTNADYLAFCEWYTKEPSFTPPTENEYKEFIETGYGIFEDRTVRNLKRVCLEASDYLKGKTTPFKHLLTDYKTKGNVARRAY